MQTQHAQPVKKRGRPTKEQNYSQMFSQYLNSLGYAARRDFLARLQLELEIDLGDIRKLSRIEAYHSAPNRKAISSLAGKDIYINSSANCDKLPIYIQI